MPQLRQKKPGIGTIAFLLLIHCRFQNSPRTERPADTDGRSIPAVFERTANAAIQQSKGACETVKKRTGRVVVEGGNADFRNTANTGEHCPGSGWWAPIGKPSRELVINEGSMMPTYEGEATTWIFLGFFSKRPHSELVTRPQKAAPAGGKSHIACYAACHFGTPIMEVSSS